MLLRSRVWSVSLPLCERSLNQNRDAQRIVGDAKQDRSVNHTQDLLLLAIDDPPSYGLSLYRCWALALFLALARRDFEEWDVYVAGRWSTLAASWYRQLDPRS